jgi:predicted DNA-binding transcriptional regulator YafY
MKLYSLLENVILEAVNRPEIERAMDGRRLVSLRYDDDEDPGGKGQRWVEIYCYGSSLADNDILRVYQIGGDTKTIQPGWKTFRSDRINDFQILGGTFEEPKPLFNPNGDRSMKRVYKITQF